MLWARTTPLLLSALCACAGADATIMDAAEADGGRADLGAGERDASGRDAGEQDAGARDTGAQDGALLDASLPYVPGDPPDGDSSFVVTDGRMPLVQGIELSWDRGPQGGFHIYAGARAERAVLDLLGEVGRSRTMVVYQLRRALDETLVASGQRTGGWIESGGSYDSPSTIVVLAPELSPEDLAGELLVLTARLFLPTGPTQKSIAYVITRAP